MNDENSLEDSIYHWDLEDNPLDDDDVELTNSPLGFIEQMIGPIVVKSIYIVTATRVSHLILDLFNIGSRRTISNAKNAVTVMMGALLMNMYLDSLGTQVGSMKILACTVISIFVTSTLLLKRLSKSQIAPGICLTFIILTMISFPIIYNEYLIYFRGLKQNMGIRMVLATLSMKFASLIHPSKRNPSNFLSVLSYLLHPASCLFGPWHPEELNSRPNPTASKSHLLIEFRQQLSNSSWIMVKAISCLAASVIVISSLLDTLMHSVLPGWTKFEFILRVYVTAQEFRFSHYYVCYFTSSLISLWDDPVEKSSTVCRMTRIEWPRSLTEVVIYWNIPMHAWLKKFVFTPIKHQSGNVTISIIVTYLLSSLLHGFKFNIWAVLMSLGMLTLIEHKFRSRLARKLNACVLARTCIYSQAKTCTRGHTRTAYNSLLVSFTNLNLSILSVVHLAFLGYIFSGDADESTYKSSLEAWGEIYYYSYIIAFMNLLLCFII